jgi:hypothetical protein
VVAGRGLVVEVHLLPALAPAGADGCTLAMLAEHAVAAVTEDRPPAGSGTGSQRVPDGRRRRRTVG